jgi:hypothetical protein
MLDDITYAGLLNLMELFEEDLLMTLFFHDLAKYS